MSSQNNNTVTIEKDGLHRLRIAPVRRFTSDRQSFRVSFTKLRQGVTTGDRIELDAYDAYMMLHGIHKCRQWYACRVSGLFYAGPHRDMAGHRVRMTDATGDQLRYWVYHARRQYGVHLYCEPVGALQTVTQQLNDDDKFQVVKQAPVHQLYPCVRFEIDDNPTPCPPPKTRVYANSWDVTIAGNCESFCMPKTAFAGQRYVAHYWLCAGLAFTRFGRNEYDTLGDRYYTRSPGVYFDRHRWGGVKELTDGNREDVIKQMGAPRFALYVCAGAKLIVMDPYRKDGPHPEGNEHNCTLVQAGGVVVVEGELELMAPAYCENKANIRTFRLRDYANDGDKTKPKCLLSSTSPELDKTSITTLKVNPSEPNTELEALSKYDCPVLFLGANESEYGSIAWFLNIYHEVSSEDPPARASSSKQKAPPKVVHCESANRRCFLEIPQGGRFEAIEDWDTTHGWQEVCDRHLYERLHEPTVEMVTQDYIHSGKRFAVPTDRAMQERILGIGTDRTISTNIYLMGSPVGGHDDFVQPPPPKQFTQ